MPIADRLKIDISKLKDYLKIEYSEDDSLLLDLVKVAKEQIDLFLNNDFVTVDEVSGNSVDLPIPFSLNLAVYQMVASWYETRSVGVTSKNVGGITYNLGTMPIETQWLLYSLRKLVGT